MKRRTVKFVAAASIAAVLTAVICSTAETNTPPAKPVDKFTELFGDSTVAKGTGFEIKRSQLDSAMLSIKANNAARGQALNAEQSTLLETQLLERLIQINLLLTKATDADRAKGKETANKQYDVILKRATSEEALTRQLKSVGMTMAELRAKMEDEATAQAVADRELKVTVSDDEVKKFYDEHPARFEQPEMVRASHILVGTMDPETRAPLSDEKKQAKRKLAEDLLKRAKAGEDFAKLAKEFSDDPGSKDNGGEYTFPRNQMVPEFESAAFALQTNQVSDIVTTQFGYHIIKLSEKLPAKKVELAKVADDLKEGLKRQQLEKLLPDYIEKMEKDAKVEILDEKLKKSAAALEAAKAAQAELKKSEEKKSEEKAPEPKK